MKTLLTTVFISIISLSACFSSYRSPGPFRETRSATMSQVTINNCLYAQRGTHPLCRGGYHD